MFLCTKRDREKLVLKIYERCIINKVGTFYIVAFSPIFSIQKKFQTNQVEENMPFHRGRTDFKSLFILSLTMKA